MSADEVRAYVEERLEETSDYTSGVAGFVAASLIAGLACEANWMPGDGTRYGLVFVPLTGLVAAPPSPMEQAALERLPRLRREGAVAGLAYEPGAALVVWADHGVLVCQFRDRSCIHWTDAKTAFGTTDGSAHALAILFDRIAGLVAELLHAERPKTLTRDEAKAAGFTGYAQHLETVRCPREIDPGIYCATCEGLLALLYKENVR